LTTTFVLIHGAGGSSWSWHLVERELIQLGHEVVAVDLPCDDDSAGLAEYTDAVVTAIGDRRGDLVLVAHSMAGFTAPLVAARIPVQLIVLVAAMVPRPGEAPGDWWDNTGWPAAREELRRRVGGDDSPEDMFLHDVDADLAAVANERARPQSGTPFEAPWPLAAWPNVPTRFVLCTEDRFFPADFLRSVVLDRLGVVPDELGAGHLPMLADPEGLVDLLEQLRSEHQRSA
jgi:pimeloyl-ACP methyl ester carboxylesterase